MRIFNYFFASKNINEIKEQKKIQSLTWAMNVIQSTFVTTKKAFGFDHVVSVKKESKILQEQFTLTQVINRLENSSADGAKELGKILSQNQFIDWRECKDSSGHTILNYLNELGDETLVFQTISLVENNQFPSTDLFNFLHPSYLSPRIIQLLANKGFDFELENSEKRNTLQEAVLRKEYDRVETLLKYRPHLVNQFNSENELTPLSIAMRSNDLKMTEILIKTGADLNTFDETWTPITYATAMDKVKMLELLLKNKVDPNYTKSLWPPLFFALKHSDAATNLLIKYGANVNYVDSQGNNFLIILERNTTLPFSKLKEIKEYLLENGLNPEIENNEKRNTLQEAVLRKAYDTVETVLKYRPHLVIQLNSENKFAPLSIAIQNNDLKMTEILIKALNTEVENNEKRNVFQEAVHSKAYDIVENLLKHKPNLVNQLNSENEFAPLSIAMQNNDLKMTEILIKSGADLNTFDKNWTPVTYATAKDKVEILELLLKNNADPNYTKSSWSPLFYALINSDKAIDLLIEYGANVNYVNSEGTNSLTILEIDTELPFSEKTRKKEYLLQHQLNPEIDNSIRPRKLLAQTWSIGNKKLYFPINKISILYGGYEPNITLPRLTKCFLSYLPQLKHHFPHYFTEDIIQKLHLSNTQAILNLNFAEISNEDILLNCVKSPQILTIDLPGHVAAVVIFKDSNDEWKLAKCNRGGYQNKDSTSGIQVYKIQNPLTPEIIDKIRDEVTPDFFNKKINELLDLKFLEKIQLKDQLGPNCSWASPKTAELAVLKFLKPKNIENPNLVLRQIYKAFTSYAREQELKTYFERIEKHPEEIDWLLLSRIRIKLEKKLKQEEKMFGLQAQNYKTALKHFDTYIKKQQLIVTNENKDTLIHYLIAIGDIKGINQAIELGADISKESSISPYYTLYESSKINPNIAHFINKNIDPSLIWRIYKFLKEIQFEGV